MIRLVIIKTVLLSCAYLLYAQVYFIVYRILAIANSPLPSLRDRTWQLWRGGVSVVAMVSAVIGR